MGIMKELYTSLQECDPTCFEDVKRLVVLVSGETDQEE